MKIVYMGTPDFAVGPLESIIKAGHEVLAVVTQPDRPKGRKGEPAPSPVKECALKYGLPVLQPEKIKRPEEIEKLKEYPADIFVVAAFGQILSEEILTMPKFGCVNIHASLLPKLRGAAPIQRAILDGEEKTGITIMQMDKGLDTGDILMQEGLKIADDETAETLFDRLCALGSDMIVKALPMIEKAELKPVKQDDALSTYAHMFSKEDGRVDFSKDAAFVERQIRACSPWPGAFSFSGGKKFIFCKALVSDDAMQGKKPGECVSDSKSLVVKCADRGLVITRIKPEGKKEMDTSDFLRGFRNADGMMFEGQA